MSPVNSLHGRKGTWDMAVWARCLPSCTSKWPREKLARVAPCTWPYGPIVRTLHMAVRALKIWPYGHCLPSGTSKWPWEKLARGAPGTRPYGPFIFRFESAAPVGPRCPPGGARRVGPDGLLVWSRGESMWLAAPSQLIAQTERFNGRIGHGFIWHKYVTAHAGAVTTFHFETEGKHFRSRTSYFYRKNISFLINFNVNKEIKNILCRF